MNQLTSAEDEGRGQRAVANGRAKISEVFISMRNCVCLGKTVGHDGVTRGGAHQESGSVGALLKASKGGRHLARWRDGTIVRPPRGRPG